MSQVTAHPTQLWRFCVDLERHGELDGIFFATQEEIDGVVGSRIYFGEVLGKHSEVIVDVRREDFEAYELSEATVAELQRVVSSRTLSGFNPLSYRRL